MIDGGSFKFDRDLSIHLFVSTYANNWDKVPNKKISIQEMMYVYSCFLFHRGFEFNSSRLFQWNVREEASSLKYTHRTRNDYNRRSFKISFFDKAYLCT